MLTPPAVAAYAYAGWGCVVGGRGGTGGADIVVYAVVEFC